MNSEEMTAEDERWVQAELSRHSSEALSPQWAPAARAAFQSDMDTIGKQYSFRVLSVDCRTTMCTTKLEWPSFQQTIRSTKAIRRYRYAKNCEILAYLPTPNDVASKYEATLIFDCATSSATE